MRNRTIASLAFAGLITVSGCASTQNPKPAVCDGKHRRPANPYGSVLPTVPLPTAGAAASPPTPAPNTPAAPVAPPPTSAPASAVAPGPMSAIDPKSFDPCGRVA